ncbi:MAG: prepilin peptidase [Planctomycetaceae bacterium]
MIAGGILYWLVLIGLGIFGAYTGRLLTICSDRFPEQDRLLQQWNGVFKPWHVCPGCRTRPSLTERLPVVGWLLNGRRCHACRRRLSIRYSFIEAVTAILFVLVYYCEIRFDAQGSLSNGLVSDERVSGPEAITTLWSDGTWLHLRYAFHMLMICGLIVATEIDRRLRIIPDGCTVPIMILAVPFSFLFGQLYTVPIWFQDASTAKTLQEWSRLALEPWQFRLVQPLLIPWDATPFLRASPHWHGLLVSVVGMIAGAGSVWVVRQIGFLSLKQEAMGFGDVVLMGMVGSVLGWQPVLAVFVIGAPVLAMFFALFNWIVHRDNEIPYGPFLSAATILLLLTWPWSWPFAKRFLDMGPLLLPLALIGAFLMGASLYAIQLLKRAFGFSSVDLQDPHDWNSADHLAYYNSERPDEQTGQWPKEQWPGCRAGRGLRNFHDWKNHR